MSSLASYDFIVVGGGTSGSVVSSRIANTTAAPSVLLIEGGGKNDANEIRSPDVRYSVAFTENDLDWGYKTVEQHQLLGQKLGYARGKGLGGSSSINFACWTLGDKHDFDKWAEMVDDDCWKWEGERGVKERFKKIEKLHSQIDDLQAEYLDRNQVEKHGKAGMVDLSYSKVWAHDLEIASFEAGRELGMEQNGDINSGDPIGMGIGPSTFYNGKRVTASSAYLANPPSNLTILTGNPVVQVLFDDMKKAVGVKTADGQLFYASKEIILSAGTIDTAKLLLLSGIGPAEELAALSIPVIHNLSGVGRNLKDHSFAPITLLLNSDKHGDLTAAPDQLYQTGGQCTMGWFSAPAVINSSQFHSLPSDTRMHLKQVPSYELITLFPPLSLGSHNPLPEDRFISILAVVMNPQSSGTVRLASSSFGDNPLIDPALLSHDYDRRVAVEGLRHAINYMRMPAFVSRTSAILGAPQSDSDEDIWKYWQAHISSTWHPVGTCKMGIAGEEGVCTTASFHVVGVKALRAVDLSVAPILPNCHTQSTAYLIGETAADKIIQEFGLNRKNL